MNGNYTSTSAIAKRWKLSERRIQTYCSQGRIPGARKQSGVWIIPEDAVKPMRLSGGKKPAAKAQPLHVLSLFSGCGGMDLGFEGGFRVPRESVNPSVNGRWNARGEDEHWVYLPKNRFHTVFANDIRPDARRAWTKYFAKYGILADTYHSQSIVDLVKLQKSNQHSIPGGGCGDRRLPLPGLLHRRQAEGL